MKYLVPILFLLLLASCRQKPAAPSKPKSGFERADKVTIVSFNERKSLPPTDTLPLIRNGHYLAEPFLEEITLTAAQRDTLRVILSTPEDTSYSSADCYAPHHAILLYEQGILSGYYEICFDCQHARSSAGFGFNRLTEDQYCTLYKFFKRAGITEMTYVKDEWICH